jgi:hypothetical protein
MAYPIQCSCGLLKGLLKQSKDVTHCECYCKDCQTFAHFLQRDTEILNEFGGTELVRP